MLFSPPLDPFLNPPLSMKSFHFILFGRKRLQTTFKTAEKALTNGAIIVIVRRNANEPPPPAKAWLTSSLIR